MIQSQTKRLPRRWESLYCPGGQCIQLVNLKFSRQDELEADGLGACFMNDAGYDPNEMIKVQEILASLSQGNEPPEYFSTHPSSANGIQLIQQQIQNISSCPQ